ncbi:hypothetical protein QBC47DRAFT_402314 [Echria macrotheca]|uniref:Uncharacterized protein n=1 Tax=Echria macrotheca TaxID=438768 RepID=A0AAJ0FB55_9PEZI|nr:hypothetical protein QBC47DRAFT_402314 [Echria macrotheca]
MDRPREVLKFGGSGPHTPTPPLALSDLLNQRPFPPYTPTYERPLTSPDTALGVADEQSVLVVASGDGTQPSPGRHDRPEIPLADAKSDTQSAPPARPSADSTDWLAKRRQLRPSKNQGSKGDWIRGWSESVSVYGEDTYCACSESAFIGDQTLVVKGGEIKSGVRAVWLKKKRPLSIPASGVSISTTSVPEADIICRYCSRMASPPAMAGITHDGAEVPHQKVNIAQKLGSLLQRVKPSRGQDSYKKYLAGSKSESPLAASLHRNARSDDAVNIPHGFSDSRKQRYQSHRHGYSNGQAVKPADQPTSLDAGSAPNPVRATSAMENRRGTDATAALPTSSTSSWDGHGGNDTAAARLRRAQAMLDKSRESPSA